MYIIFILFFYFYYYKIQFVESFVDFSKISHKILKLYRYVEIMYVQHQHSR